MQELSSFKDFHHKHISECNELTERMNHLQEQMRKHEDTINASENRIEQSKGKLDEFIESPFFKNFKDNHENLYQKMMKIQKKNEADLREQGDRLAHAIEAKATSIS